MRCYTKTFNGNEKRLIMKIRKMNAYTNSNRADTGLFLFEGVVSSTSNINRRIIEIKCSLYNKNTMFSATDLIPNLSTIGIFFKETDDYVEVYVSQSAYANVSMTLITCDNPAIYDFAPYSDIVLSEDDTYTNPVELGSIVEVSYTLGDNIKVISASGTVQKMFYNHNTKMIDGELCLQPSATGNQTILYCPAMIQNTNANEGLVYYAYAWIDSDSDGAADDYQIFPVLWDRVTKKLTGKIPKNCIRFSLPIHAYLADGLIS